MAEVEDRTEPPKVHTRPPTGTVLVIEDEEPLRSLVHTVLETAGYKVLAAPNGREALLLSRDYPGHIDLVLTDVVMPGMSGPQVVEELRGDRNHPIVLFMSGYDRDLMDQRTVCGDVNFLPKPFTPQALLFRISELLGARADSGATSSGPTRDARHAGL